MADFSLWKTLIWLEKGGSNHISRAIGNGQPSGEPCSSSRSQPLLDSYDADFCVVPCAHRCIGDLCCLAVYLLRSHTVHLCFQTINIFWAINSIYLKWFLHRLPQLISLPWVMQKEAETIISMLVPITSKPCY